MKICVSNKHKQIFVLNNFLREPEEQLYNMMISAICTTSEKCKRKVEIDKNKDFTIKFEIRDSELGHFTKIEMQRSEMYKTDSNSDVVFSFDRYFDVDFQLFNVRLWLL